MAPNHICLRGCLNIHTMCEGKATVFAACWNRKAGAPMCDEGR